MKHFAEVDLSIEQMEHVIAVMRSAGQAFERSAAQYPHIEKYQRQTQLCQSLISVMQGAIRRLQDG